MENEHFINSRAKYYDKNVIYFRGLTDKENTYNVTFILKKEKTEENNGKEEDFLYVSLSKPVMFGNISIFSDKIKMEQSKADENKEKSMEEYLKDRELFSYIEDKQIQKLIKHVQFMVSDDWFPKSKNKDEDKMFFYDESKLGRIRKRTAVKIDEALGTAVRFKNIPRPLKKIEKAVSDRLFGKTRD